MIKIERAQVKSYNPEPGDLFSDGQGMIWYCLDGDKATCLINVDHEPAVEQTEALEDVPEPLTFEGRLTHD